MGVIHVHDEAADGRHNEAREKAAAHLELPRLFAWQSFHEDNRRMRMMKEELL